MTVKAQSVAASQLLFAPYGSGSVARTVSEALRAMVRSGDYALVANFNTARDALTETVGVRHLQIGTSSASSNAALTFPSRTSGRGPTGMISYDATFNSTVDPNISVGYNLASDGTASEAGEPQLHLAFEGNYNDGSGQNKMETYIQVSGLSGQTTEVYRPHFTQINRSTRSVTNQFFADLHQFAGANTVTALSALDVYPTHVDFPCGQTTSTGNFFSVSAATSGNTPLVQPAGVDTNINSGWSSKGSGGHIFYTGAGTRVVLVLNNIASSVNYLDLYPSAAGGTPTIRIAGSDSDCALGLTAKGTSAIRFFTNSTAAEQVQITHTASANRQVKLTGSNGGNPTIDVSAGILTIGGTSVTINVPSGGSTSISSGTGTVKMTSTNNANNAAWIPLAYAGTTYYVPAWTAHNP